MGSRVELFEEIRRDHRREELSVRALADRHGVHRRTVRQALAAVEPAARKTPARAAPKLDPAKPLIDAMLREDLTAWRKQRHTARRVLARLVDEHGMGELRYSSVRDYVARRRPEIWAEAGRGVETGFVPQTHEPAAEAEVDFGDLWVNLDGVATKCFLFTLRLSYSGKAVHRVFASQGQEAFLEGHVHAFTVLGGVPVVHIRYDNLKAAVSRVLSGRTRTESARWVLFRSAYGFDAFYCEPGIDGAHEKGGVEGEVGRFRRNHLVPVPTVGTLAELNERIDAADAADERRRVGNRTTTVGDDFVFEKTLLRPLPAEGFDPGLVLTPRVDRYARVTVRQCAYSVPARLIGKTVRVSLRASELLVFDGKTLVARHARAVHRGSQTLLLDHYLEVLVRKPGALPGATALAQARAAGVFTDTHQRFWDRARGLHGDGAGTRVLIEALLLHRHLPHDAVLAGLEVALAAGSFSADLVAIEARKAAGRDRPGQGQILSLDRHRTPPGPAPELPGDDRPLPGVAHYDQLLTRKALS